MFAGYEQLDAQEFLLILLDSLHEDLNKVRSSRTTLRPLTNHPAVTCKCSFLYPQVRRRPKLSEQKNDGVDDEVAGEKAWQMHKTVHDSIMVEIFQVRSTTINWYHFQHILNLLNVYLMLLLRLHDVGVFYRDSTSLP